MPTARTGDSRAATSVDTSQAPPKVRSGRSRPHNGRRGWALWTLRRRAIVYVLTVEALTAGVITHCCIRGITVTATQWAQFIVLTIAAHLHQAFSRDREERRRAHHGSQGMHVDLTSIFAIPAAVLLPIPLTALLIIGVRVGRYRIARKPLFRFTLTSASILLGACSAHGLVVLAIDQHLVQRVWSPANELLLIAASAIYVIQQILVIGGAVVLSADGPLPPASMIFGDREHIAIAALSASLGIVLASTTAAPAAGAVMLFVAVSINGLVGHRERGRRDGGTGLLNKARWTELATARLTGAIRDRQTAAMLVIDLDHFKEVNDTYGHLVGDMLLQRVANVLTNAIRGSDVAGRFGGEEFVVLLGDADHALEVAERIRVDIEAITLIFERAAGGEPIVLAHRTASIGVAVAPEHVTTLTGLLEAADNAVYRAKHNGRNQIALSAAKSPVPPPA